MNSHVKWKWQIVYFFPTNGNSFDSCWIYDTNRKYRSCIFKNLTPKVFIPLIWTFDFSKMNGFQHISHCLSQDLSFRWEVLGHLGLKKKITAGPLKMSSVFGENNSEFCIQNIFFCLFHKTRMRMDFCFKSRIG